MNRTRLAWLGFCRLALWLAAALLEGFAWAFNGGSGWCARAARKLNDRAAFL